MTRSIYVIKAKPGPAKIGIASKPARRFCSLQAASSVPLLPQYVGECDAEDANLDTWLIGY
jgi:hypothetical protein